MDYLAITRPKCPRDLIAAIFLSAIKDLNHKRPKWRKDAKAFLQSDWAKYLAELIDIEEDHLSRLYEH